jgi:hypothetical protein
MEAEMPNVPKIVHERLRAPGSAAVDHPDANLLTAFSESVLPESERTLVLDHLARCGECREIVAMALPASEPAGEITKYPARPWFTWPTLRWGFVTAGLAAVALFGVLQYQRRSAPQVAAYHPPSAPLPEARNEPQRVPPAREEAKEGDKVEYKARRDALTGTPGSKPKTAPDKRISADQVPAAATSVLAKSGVRSYSARTLPHGPMLANQQQMANQQSQSANQSANVAQAPSSTPLSSSLNSRQNAAANPAAPGAVEANSEMVQVEAQSTAPSIAAPESMSGLMVKNEPLPPPSAQSGQDETKIDRAKPATTGTALKSLPDAGASQLQGRSKALLAGNLRWTINSAGGLQRSLDQGTTWQDVSVNDSYGYAGAAGFEVVSSSNAKAKDSGKADQKLADKKASAPPVFRTVAANGLDVWAGGAAGLLYHSIDAGAHWTRIAPSSAGAVLTGDILSMEFPDTQHGRVTTSTGETWTTDDAGQNWQKQ